MECPTCRQTEIGQWDCTSNASNGAGNVGSMLEGADICELNITILPIMSVLDSLDESPQSQPSSDTSLDPLPMDTAPAVAVPTEIGVLTPLGLPPPNAPLLFSQEPNDLHVEADALEQYRELYPDIYRTVMTIQRASAAMGRGSEGDQRTGESIWAEPSHSPEAGAESIWADTSFSPEAGWGAPPPNDSEEL